MRGVESHCRAANIGLVTTLSYADIAVSPPSAEGSTWTATGLEPQVFLDRSGRRARRVRLGGTVAALAAAGWFGALVSGAAGFSTLPAVPTTLAASHRQQPQVVPALRRNGIVRVASTASRPVADRG